MAAEPPLQPQLLEGLAKIVAAFERHGVRYALIGGLAVGFHSRPRSTRDIDFVLTVPQVTLPTLLADLTNDGFTLDESAVIADFVQHGMTAFHYQGVRIDWLKPLVPLYQQVLETGRATDGFGRPLQVASAEGLILLKLLAGRNRDWGDIDELLASNRGRLDLDWIEREWRTVSDTDDPIWQRFRQAVADIYERP